jgi:hypothetical protein
MFPTAVRHLFGLKRHPQFSRLYDFRTVVVNLLFMAMQNVLAGIIELAVFMTSAAES